MKNVLIFILISVFLVGCQGMHGVIKDESKEVKVGEHSEDVIDEKALVLDVENIKILPATEETGAPELVCDIVFKNQGNKHLLVNLYYRPWIKALEPKGLFRIEEAIPPPHDMRMPDASDLVRIPPNGSYIYKYELWFESVFVGNPFNKGYIYNVLKSGEYTISFGFTSSPDESLEEYRKENEVWWKGEVSSPLVKFIFDK